MDIYCSHCGEPWEIDSLHELIVAEGISPDFSSARKRFYLYGCGAFEKGTPVKCTHSPVTSKKNLDAYSALQDVLGDDIDGLASMYDDFGLS
jgi:hypothetical protein